MTIVFKEDGLGLGALPSGLTCMSFVRQTLSPFN